MFEGPSALFSARRHALYPLPNNFAFNHDAKALTREQNGNMRLYLQSQCKSLPPGRPHMGEEKRVQISIHLDGRLRAQLEAAAKRAVRSLSGEAAYRIRESPEFDDEAPAA